MGAQNERGLEEQLVHDPTAAAVAVEAGQVAMGTLGVLVAEAEAQEFRREEADVRADGPLVAGTVGILRRVVPYAERPASPGLQLPPAVPAKLLRVCFWNRS